MKKTILSALALLMATTCAFGYDMQAVSRLSEYQTRTVSPENLTGAPGKGAMADPKGGVIEPNVSNLAVHARELGKGWKVNPFMRLDAGKTLVMADIADQGFITSIWMTIGQGVINRHIILRMYWDDETEPSVECPVADFFCNAMEQFAQVSSLAVCVNPGNAFNCYWKMPFRKRAKITLENIGDRNTIVFYQINYASGKIDPKEAYFHAQFRRSNPTEDALHTVLDGVKGKGNYVGTYMFWRVHNNRWWGEGEVKFYIDGDDKYPTICTTGAEDYFCGSFNFEDRKAKRYQSFNTPYAGVPQIVLPDGLYQAVLAFGMYRWHIPDPIHFNKDMRVTVQDMGYHQSVDPNKRLFRKQYSDISSVAYWYQTEPHAPFPALPKKYDLTIE